MCIMKEMTRQDIVGSPFVWAAAAGSMDRFWKKLDPEWLILSAAALAALVVVAAYLVAKIRPKPEKKEHLASQWLSKYSELHSKGGLSDEEFRTIKTKLAEQLQDELNDNGENG
jgi:hypothetical protein